MSTPVKERITIETTVNAPVEKTWSLFNSPEHVIKWNSAIPEWHTPRAENDLRTGGKFLFRMEARDGSMGFDFGGVYDRVDLYNQIDYTLGDGRKVNITFTKDGGKTGISETFDPESENPIEMQRGGWQSILDNFKKYAEQ
ncbi:SRPBCC family protein [Flavitalea flava]